MKDKTNILIIEDNPADVRLLEEALKESTLNPTLYVLADGSIAIRFLDEVKGKNSQGLPHLILLDLNLPQKNGFEILKHIKDDKTLKRIPVIVLSSSQNPDDIAKAYELHANCYLTKPVDLEPFFEIVKAVEYFWFQLARLPFSSKG
ncbi:MAG: response regulator [Nitrospirae bacterium]|nr:response regulator [Nitrospirota bacterium]MDA1304461.1 response regulator [Nitrospirota bacterium]